MPSGQLRGSKSRRITRACDYCHQRSIRCVNDAGASPCKNCAEFNQACTFNREFKRRGVKPKQRPVPGLPAAHHHRASVTPDDRGPSGVWKAPMLASQAIVVDLVDIYFEIVYPIFPLFHRPTYVRKISRGDYNKDRNLFAVTMAMCALVSARVRDRALFNTSWDVQELSEPQSEVFYEASRQASQIEQPENAQDLNVMRTHALLALVAIQYGKTRDMQAHLGRYHTLVAIHGLHDEANWPQDLGLVETEERRRLFWSMYTLEVYTSIIWNGITRVRDQQISVAYTTEVDDEFFSDRGYSQRAPSPVEAGPNPDSRFGDVKASSWLCGWNFTTDLYRVLEHVITNLRDRKRHKRTSLNDMFGPQQSLSESFVRDNIMRLFNNLPQCFRECPEVTCDPVSDRYGFQAANIIATVQLMRILLSTSGGGSIGERCAIAQEVVDDFSRIPVAYLRATSSPLFHHLAGIGIILGSVIEEPMDDSTCQQLRVVLLALVQLLETLDQGVRSAVGAQRLRSMVAQIDSHMTQQRQFCAPSNEGTVAGGQQFAGAPALPQVHPQVLQPTPMQLPIELFEDLSWNVDFMQFTGNWS